MKAISGIDMPDCRRFWRKHLPFGALLVLLIPGCINPIKEVSFDDEQRIILPILSTSFTLEEALGEFSFEGTLAQDSAGNLLLRRVDTVLVRYPLRAVQLPRTPFPLLDTVVRIDLDDLGLLLPVRQVDFWTASLNYALASGRSEDVRVEFTMPNFTINGEELNFEVIIPGSEGRALGIHHIDLSRFSVGSERELVLRYKATLPNGERVLLSSGFVGINDYFAREAIGQLDSLFVPLGLGSIPTEFLNAFEPNTAAILDAEVEFVVGNSSEVPFRVGAFRNFANLRNGTEYDFNTPLDNGVFIRERVSAGDTTRTTILFDESNSGFVDAVRQVPDSITLDLYAIANPDRVVQDYVLDWQDQIFAFFQFDTPLKLNFEQFVVNQPFEIPEIVGQDDIHDVYVNYRVEALAGFGASLQVYLLDEAGAVVDSLLESRTTMFDPGEVASNNQVVAPSIRKGRFPIRPTALDRLRLGSSAEARLYLLSRPGEFAWLTNDAFLSIDLGIDFLR